MITKDNLSIIGSFVKFRYKSDGFSVLILKVLKVAEKGPDLNGNTPKEGDIVSAVGSLPVDMFYDGSKHLFNGRWVPSKYGYQLKIDRITAIDPHGKKDIIKFLSSGIIKGIGPVTAIRLVEHFGEDTLDVLDDNPRAITQVKGIGQSTADKIINSWKEQRGTAKIITTLCSYGLSVTYARKVLLKFGGKAIDLIKDNPYILTEIRGIGFLKADEVAREFGLEADNPARVAAGIAYTMENATYKEGNCYLPIPELLKRSQELLGIEMNIIKQCLYEEGVKGILFVKETAAYIERIYDAEKYVSGRIYQMAYEPSPVNMAAVAKILDKTNTLTDEQKDAVTNALSRRLSVITGLPGTGKTYSLNSILNVLDTIGMSYAIAAPTGKAAKRIAEVTGREAVTIHRLLGVKKGGALVEFDHDKSNPLPVNFVIVDETSMMDIVLTDALFSAIQKSTSVILVGDFNQLPSVGPGRILRDLIEDKLCTVNVLKKIQRQAEDSAIVNAAHIIHAGGSLRSLPNDTDFIFIKEDEPVKIRDAIVDIVSSQKYAPVEHTQVLTPMKKGDVGTRSLNNAMREPLRMLNINTLKAKGYPVTAASTDSGETNSNAFYPGDKIIQLENNYDKEVFNGEVGYVVKVDNEEKTVSILFDDKIITYDDYDLDQIDLAYALTVHKFQGSEMPCIVMPITTQHYIMLYRNLIYTAVTRARQKLVVVGTEKAIAIAVKNDKQLLRYSALSGAIRS